MRPRKTPAPDALNPVPLFVVALILFVVFAMVQFIDDNAPLTPEQALEQAVLDHDVLAAEMALAQGAGVNHPNSFDNQTVLHRAAWRGQADMVELLLRRGGDPNRRDSHSGETPLHSAVRGNHPAVVRLLLAAGADPFIALLRESEQCISGMLHPAGSTATDIARRAGFAGVADALQRSD
ncbi:MAG: ankyrin repeat domain-containing protein [Alcanivoracaceae bacterium]